MRFRHLVAGSFVGTALGSAYILHENDWDLNSLGFVRFGRSAFTAAAITHDYKTSVYRKDMPKDAKEVKTLWSQTHTRSANRILDLCNNNGGVFIKVGQHLGALDFLIPQEYVDTLKILHSQAPISSLEDVCSVIKDDLKIGREEIFSEFDENQIGSASLAQVYKARLKTGEKVAVKVQHKHVKARSYTDIKTMEFLVYVASKIFPDFKFQWLVDQMKTNIPLELDFIHEGNNAEKIAKNLAHFEWLKIPKVHWKHTTSRVLIMEFFEGGQVNDLKYVEKNGLSPNEIVTKLGKLYSEMIFKLGYIHCDPHPGNLLVRKTKKGKLEICLLDHGLYTTLSDEFRNSYAKFWLSILKSDVKGIRESSEELNVGQYYQLFSSMVTARNWQSISGPGGITKKRLTSEEKNQIRANVQAFIVQISEVLNRIPPPMVLIFKTNDLLRGIEHSLHTSKTMMSFTTMTKYCISTVYSAKIAKCETSWCRFRHDVIEKWQLLKIRLYELYLRFITAFGRAEHL